MSINTSGKPWVRVAVVVALVAIVAACATFTRDRWLPWLRYAVAPQQFDEPIEDDHADHDHSAHDHSAHDHSGHNDDAHQGSAEIELSDEALKNIGFEPLEIKLADYDRKLTLPAMVVERPGRSQRHVTAPLTGVVTEIHAVPGEAVADNAPLFELRLTHEELVAAQRDLLRTVESLAVVRREIARLESLGEGVVAGRRVLEQQYERQRLEASLRAERQALLLHGIDAAQIDEIINSRELFRTITVGAPPHIHADDRCPEKHQYVVQSLAVAQGEQVAVGQELAVLADHCELYIEARAFADDAEAIREASVANRTVTARLLSGASPGDGLAGLEIVYAADQIDPGTRALKFYVRLPNQVVLDRTTPDGRRFLQWRYKPGQRMQVGVPVETWQDQIVLPTTAVIDDGAESYVYTRHGEHFDRVSVEILHRDPGAVVVAKTGALRPGATIAARGAYQIHLAIKNQSGGAIDPHAGHNH